MIDNREQNENENENRVLLGELMIAGRAINHSQLKAALTVQGILGGRIGEILVTNKCISCEMLDEYLTRQMRIKQGGTD